MIYNTADQFSEAVDCDMVEKIEAPNTGCIPGPKENNLLMTATRRSSKLTNSSFGKVSY